MSWQVQEAKQRFSQALRAVADNGPQVITRHGEDVAVVIDIDEYRSEEPSTGSGEQAPLTPQPG